MSNIKACKKHIDNPAICYASCPGCEMERLRSERDVARRDYEVMNKFREAAEQERDAALEREQTLAAHVEVLKAAVEFCNEHHHFGGWSGLLNSLDEQDSINLAHRDLINQAEAYEGIAAVGKAGRVKHSQLASFSESTAQELRQRAQSLK